MSSTDPAVNMADLEAVLADVSYLMAMEKSKSTPAARASKKIILPDPRYCDCSADDDAGCNVQSLQQNYTIVRYRYKSVRMIVRFRSNHTVCRLCLGCTVRSC